jgi:hypothetical protein
MTHAHIRHTDGFVLGLDLGQVADYTALCILECLTEGLNEWTTDLQQKTTTLFHVRHLERPPLGTPYPDIVTRVEALVRSAPLQHAPTALVVDATGVGRPVVDLFRQAKLNPRPITITGGDTEQYADGGWRVPKRNLVSTLQVALQANRLRVAKGLPEAAVLVDELLNFKVKITVAAHDTYEAWREGQHDDLVLATALALWWGEQRSRWSVTTVRILGV